MEDGYSSRADDIVYLNQLMSSQPVEQQRNCMLAYLVGKGLNSEGDSYQRLSDNPNLVNYLLSKLDELGMVNQAERIKEGLEALAKEQFDLDETDFTGE